MDEMEDVVICQMCDTCDTCPYKGNPDCPHARPDAHRDVDDGERYNDY